DLLALALVSRVLYIFARDEGIWKNLTLDRWCAFAPEQDDDGDDEGDDGADDTVRRRIPGGTLVYKADWFETYFRPGTVDAIKKRGERLRCTIIVN
ncbi:hypothetical protein HDU93_001851, partial [Gonapodya sp. JEL0774]